MIEADGQSGNSGNGLVSSGGASSGMDSSSGSTMESQSANSSTNLQLQIGPGTNRNSLTLTLLGTQAGINYRLFSRSSVSRIIYSNGLPIVIKWQSGALITGQDSQTGFIVTNNGSNMFFTVVECPMITSQPTNQASLPGSNVTFSVTATGAARWPTVGGLTAQISLEPQTRLIQ